MKLSGIFTILCGLLLIAVITPLSQFLTISTLNADIETATPIGWAVGIVFSIVLALAAVRLVSKTKRFKKENIVILYTMLTLAVPVMNLGLVRQVYHSVYSVFFEYLYYGTSTYRTAYNAKNATWFPLIPDREGLAWNKANRVLKLLSDPKSAKERTDAQRRVLQAVDHGTPENQAALTADVGKLGTDEINAIWAEKSPELLERAGIGALLKTQFDQAWKLSAQTGTRISNELARIDDLEANHLPENLSKLDRSSVNRLQRELLEMTPAQRQVLDGKIAELAARAPELRAEISQLSRSDYNLVLSQMAGAKLESYARMPGSEVNHIRQNFVYRLTLKERRTIFEQDGAGGSPNENLKSWRFSLWSDLASQQEKARHTARENITELFHQLPWRIWARPMAMWSLLITAIFLLLMCMAELLRRKWVDRENLAFPLVEIADNIIRHDARLESAEDLRNPETRHWAFSPLFLIGAAIAFSVLSLEALGHYQVIGASYVGAYDISKNIFTTGGLKEMDKVIFVVSPIVLGLLFLVNLEISFSIWVCFIIYKLLVLIPKLSGTPWKDSSFTGYGGGMDYPFQMEQFLGASLCFSAIVLFKTFRKSREVAAPVHATETNHFIPPRLTVAGLILLPLLIGAMAWGIGITNIPFLLLVGLIAVAQTVAAARARAETGLPAQHVSYEFTKLPLIFGMTGFTGAKVYTNFLAAAFLPMSLLFRTLPQHLENMELARRFRIKYRTIAISGFLGFITALLVGGFSFLIFSYYLGERFNGSSIIAGSVPGGMNAASIATYPLYISHFRGEAGLDKYTDVHWIRVVFIGVGVGVIALLTFLRSRFLKFPIHPIGYFLLLASLWYVDLSPYQKGDATGESKEASWLWGSALVAWMLKKLIIKYGGMNSYKQIKPLFVGLVVGAVVCIFTWNVTHLVCAICAQQMADPNAFIKVFAGKIPYSPRFY